MCSFQGWAPWPWKRKKASVSELNGQKCIHMASCGSTCPRFIYPDHHEIHLAFTHCFNLQHTDLWRILGWFIAYLSNGKAYESINTGLARKSVWVFLQALRGKPKWTFWPTQHWRGTSVCNCAGWERLFMSVASWKGLSPGGGLGRRSLPRIRLSAHPAGPGPASSWAHLSGPEAPTSLLRVFPGGQRQPTEMLRMRRNRERVKGSPGVPHFSSLLYIQESISQLCLCRWLFTFSLNSQKVPSLQNHVHSHALYVQ